MDEMKKQIQRRLVANILMDKCAQRDSLVFRDAWCSQERVIRFTTLFCRKLFPNTHPSAGHWKTGDEVMYEVENGVDSCVVNCVYFPIGAARLKQGIIHSWDISDEDVNALFAKFDTLLDVDIPAFEKQLSEKLVSKTTFTEGEQKETHITKYERNPKARAACLAHHGYSCKMCGMNFEETYGPECKDIIEVHHIVPLCEIGEEYVVDPIKDLIPVCPNCHTAIHRKMKCE